MGNLSKVGRIFFGIAIAGMGLQAIYYGKLPYMLIPPTHFPSNVHAILAYIFGFILSLAGFSMVFGIKAKPISLLLGALLLLIFCFYYIPYQFISNTYV